MRGKVLVCLSIAALLGTFAMPPLPEATAQMHWKKKKHWAQRGNGVVASVRTASCRLRPEAESLSEFAAD